MASSTKMKTASVAAKRAKARAGADPKLDTDTQAQLGTLLQRMYGDLLNEPVPERFTQILNRVTRADTEGRS